MMTMTMIMMKMKGDIIFTLESAGVLVGSLQLYFPPKSVLATEIDIYTHGDDDDDDDDDDHGDGDGEDDDDEAF